MLQKCLVTKRAHYEIPDRNTGEVEQLLQLDVMPLDRIYSDDDSISGYDVQTINLRPSKDMKGRWDQLEIVKTVPAVYEIEYVLTVQTQKRQGSNGQEFKTNKKEQVLKPLKVVKMLPDSISWPDKTTK